MILRNFALLLGTLTVLHATKPNFVIVLGDDHGFYHSSVYGSPEFQTPNMEALAASGIYLTNAYVASPSCAPSRAALFTGLMPYRNGIVGNHERDLKPGVKPLLPNLIAQGYEIAFSGKVGHASLGHHKAYIPKEVTIIERDPRASVTLANVKKFLQTRKDPARPLALFIGTVDTHTPWPSAKDARISPDDVVIPPRIYETPETRIEMSRYVEAAENIDGRSFAKVLTGETKTHRDLIFATHKGDKGFNVYPIRSVRKGNWKYILNLHPEFQYTTHTDLLSEDGKGDAGHGGYHWPSYLEAAKTDPAAAAFLTDYYRSPAEELYDIIKDPFEKNNLARTPGHAAKLAELRALIEARMIAVGDDKSISGRPRLLKVAQHSKVASTKIHQEKEGTLIIEAENTTSPYGNWKRRTTLKPFTGDSYLEFMGNNPGVGPPNSPLVFKFQINTPGDYWLSIRSHKRLTGDDGITARSDMCNDCYIRMQGDFTSGAKNLPLPWLKKDMKFWGNAADLDWKNWSFKLVGEHDKIIDARYRFKAGKIYTLTISGRAQRFSIDRIVITKNPDNRFNAKY